MVAAPMKAVIPAAGFGTRFLPYTKTQPKEMLPILDKPTIQYVVEEAVQSGLVDIIIVTGRSKRAIEDHFDGHPELERHLREQGKVSILRELTRLQRIAHIAYVRQTEPLGNGHAVLSAEVAVGREPFAVLLGDDITISRKPCTRDLARYHSDLGASCIAAQRVPRNAVSSYGMIVGDEVAPRLYRVKEIVEKPAPGKVVSDLVTIGRYVFTPAIFNHLRRTRAGRGGEIWLTDGIRSLLRSEDVYAWEFPGKRLDVGTKEGWLLANLTLAWQSMEYRLAITGLINELSKADGPRR